MSAADGTLTADDWSRAIAAIEAAERILLVCHVNPDGDALGSMLGCALGLRALGRPVQATFPSPFELPDTFASMPGCELLVEPAAAMTAPDLLITFDAASVERLGDLADRVATAGDVLVIDHHVTNTRYGKIHLVDPDAAATAVVVERLRQRLGVPLDAQIAECLYIGVSTDTGSFKYPATSPEVHAFAARLLATGIPHAEISRRLFDTRPFGALQILGEALARATLEPGAAGGRGLAWTYVTREDLARHAQPPEVLESMIDVIRTAAEPDVTCLVKEVAAHEWAVSLRSKGAVDVGRVAVALGGGGHVYAAGFTAYGQVTEIVDALRTRLADAASASAG